MGIKFLCPNGHKLNVKSFLKGKKAICPKCGARVMVPDDSQTNSDEQDSGAELALASTADGVAIASSTHQVAASSQTPPSSRALPATPGAATAPATPPENGPTVNPIDEAPTAVWYVRPATGGQFGPASGEIMRAWISEGRVGASSLVWRAGWPEWRAASAVFPALGKLLASPVATAAVQAVAAKPTVAGSAAQPALPVEQGTMPAGESLPPVAQSMRKRRRKNDQTLIISGVLLIITLVLVAVLAFVWQNQQAGGEAEKATPAAEESSGLNPVGAPRRTASV